MVIIGLLLAAAAVAVGVGIVMENSAPATLTAFGHTVPGVTAQWQVFFAGAAVAIVFILGTTTLFAGVGRRRRKRRDRRELRREREESLNTLEMERRRLQRELAGARSAPARPAPSRDAARATVTDAPRRTPCPDVPVATGRPPAPAPRRPAPAPRPGPRG
ncbi:hypothetical protein [Actinomadura parmotrematis]|uniref:LapA family protein n=1 Tax=Actinomadura parmotrematis TaxID=2864039 RepID=A0ABS7FQU9_9ACTN|nr:hypothetical protein [Actinomadura parmotrematis]MBW8481932.1 hypothetical protein [Actinomadura parmotrematis]